MKRCSKCQVEKPLSDFHKNRKRLDGVQGQCKPCNKATDSAGYRANREWYVARNAAQKELIRSILHEAKNVPCTDCGVQYPYYVMQFDHLPEYEKLYVLSEAVRRNLSEAVVRAEIAKCDVVCANCHAERTHNRK